VLSCFDRMLFRGYLPIMSGWQMAKSTPCFFTRPRSKRNVSIPVADIENCEELGPFASRS